VVDKLDVLNSLRNDPCLVAVVTTLLSEWRCVVGKASMTDLIAEVTEKGFLIFHVRPDLAFLL
jgi:hypothetical protein